MTGSITLVSQLIVDLFMFGLSNHKWIHIRDFHFYCFVSFNKMTSLLLSISHY